MGAREDERDSGTVNMLCTDVSEMFAAAVCGKQKPKRLRIKTFPLSRLRI